MGESINHPKAFWNERYAQQNTGWDLGEVSPPLKSYIDQIEDKSKKILIPGAGNSYEAEYLEKLGFTDITVIDIAPILVERLKEKFNNNSAVHIIEGDFFDHEEKYDLILEQTFFCAISPSLRRTYIEKVKSLLKPKGTLVGVLFDRSFEGGPPFGGSKKEYKALFSAYFKNTQIIPCYNSHLARQGSEVFIRVRQG